jgi:hypothetical protein
LDVAITSPGKSWNILAASFNIFFKWSDGLSRSPCKIGSTQIDGRHLTNQIVFEFVFQFNQQIFININVHSYFKKKSV